MRARRTALTLLAAVALVGCGGGKSKPPVMPEVTGLRLDVAKADLKAAGLSEKRIEVVGGGAFGVLNESNWTVCEQNPDSGVVVERNARVIVDRTCSTP
jgi:beta-lactam-binding protein with PASTA domain